MINSRSVMPNSAVRSFLRKRLKGRIRFIVVAMAGKPRLRSDSAENGSGAWTRTRIISSKG